MTNDHGIATAYIGIGSNLGDRLGYLQRAASRLAGSDDVSVDFAGGFASLYETSAVGVGFADRPPFLNSAFRIRTCLSPQSLLGAMLGIEAQLGRSRRTQRESRVIDLDLLLFDNAVINEAGLHVPHPRLHERRFVLEPLAEIASGAIHPILGISIKELAEKARCEFPDQKLERVGGPLWVSRHSIASESGVFPRISLDLKDETQ